MAKASARVTLSADERDRIDTAKQASVNALDAARTSAGVTPLEMALSCGVVASEMTRALDGERRFDFAWLYCQPQAFREALWHRVAVDWKVRPNRRRRDAVGRVINAIQELVLTLEE